MYFSTNPLKIGGCLVHSNPLIDSSLDISFMRSDTNCVPKSERITKGTRTLLNTCEKRSATSTVDIVFTGKASQDLVV